VTGNKNNQNDIVPIDELDFFTSEYLTEVDGSKPVVSNAFDQLFLNSNRIPKSLKNLIIEGDNIEKKLLLEEALLTHVISKPFWKEKQLKVEIFGTVCLADDRAFLDNVIAHGSMITGGEKYSLKQVVESGLLPIGEVDWSAYPEQEKINTRLSNKGKYFHISLKSLAKGCGVGMGKDFRNRIQARMRRLRNMELRVTTILEGV
jgi:hypothetical protein